MPELTMEEAPPGRVARQAILDEALRLHAAGWWVVPQQGKRAVALGWNSYRLSEEDLRGYLDHGNLNIAVVLSQSEVMDVECDGPEAERRIRKLCKSGELQTPTWRSRRGLHRLFKRPPGLPDRAALEVEDIEFRIGNQGALSTIPPSVHESGAVYEWLPGLSIWDIVPSLLPESLVNLLKSAKKPTPAQTGGGEAISEGRRNDELFRYGCRLLRANLKSTDIRNALEGCNSKQCRPPLTDAEVSSIAASVEKFRSKQAAGVGSGKELELLPCESWDELINAWRKSGLKWTEGLDRALSVMMASACSVKLVGDQLWVKIMSPPSTGKSILAQALSVNKAHVHALSVFKGFYSGFQADKEGTESFSEVEKLRDKAFIIKDGDSILTAPNRIEIIGQGRDLYDTSGSVGFKNRMSRHYDNLRFAWILCGTKSLRVLDHSELGQRFLDCRIMNSIDDDLEREIGWRKINQVRSHRFEVDGRADTMDSPEMIEAKQLTGGYLGWLRTNVGRLYLDVEMSDVTARQCMAYGEFIAYLRARPSKLQDEEESGRELSARLISQIGKLALCLAVVMNRPLVDDEVLRRVRQVALDTAYGRTLEIAMQLRRAGDQGLTLGALANLTGQGEQEEYKLLRFMRKLGAVQHFRAKVSGIQQTKKWRLTDKMVKLYDAVMDG